MHNVVLTFLHFLISYDVNLELNFLLTGLNELKLRNV